MTAATLATAITLAIPMVNAAFVLILMALDALHPDEAEQPEALPLLPRSDDSAESHTAFSAPAHCPVAQPDRRPLALVHGSGV